MRGLIINIKLYSISLSFKLVSIIAHKIMKSTLIKLVFFLLLWAFLCFLYYRSIDDSLAVPYAQALIFISIPIAVPTFILINRFIERRQPLKTTPSRFILTCVSSITVACFTIFILVELMKFAMNVIGYILYR
jgi:hypothetical protein